MVNMIFSKFFGFIKDIIIILFLNTFSGDTIAPGLNSDFLTFSDFLAFSDFLTFSDFLKKITKRKKITNLVIFLHLVIFLG